ncbi:MAG TPA: hypothetical protein VFB79_19130 [Candidatus Angelobacter sp.]|nr:hypothetical protein [Candidatus Angelobacter sp.]
MDLRKVYGGTAIGQASRCDSCVYARIIRGYAQSEKITICDRIFESIRIPFPVSECTDYADKRLPCIEDLEQIAWDLKSKSAGRRAGFHAPDIFVGSQDESGEELGPAVEPDEVPAAAKTK